MSKGKAPWWIARRIYRRRWFPVPDVLLWVGVGLMVASAWLALSILLAVIS